MVRRGAVVVRPTGHHSPAVHQVLLHLEQVGFVGSPRLMAVDHDARTETLTFLDGEAGDHPLPDAFTTEAALRSAAELLHRFHDAMEKFQIPPGAAWWLPSVEPTEIVVHGDFAPYNCVLRDGVVTGVFDFDTAHPAPKLWDVGYAAYRWVPLVDPTNPEGFGSFTDQVSRFHSFCGAYGTSDFAGVIDNARARLLAMVESMGRLAADGHPAFQAHIANGHDHLYLNDVAYLAANQERLVHG